MRNQKLETLVRHFIGHSIYATAEALATRRRINAMTDKRRMKWFQSANHHQTVNVRS